MPPLTLVPAVERLRGMIEDARPSLARALGRPSTRDLCFGLAFLGVAAIAVGCFVPVADAGSVSFSRIHDNSLGLSGIGLLTLLLCGVLVITLTRSLRRGEPTWGPVIGGLLVVTEAVYIGAAELTTCPVGASLAGSSACQAASPGLGLFMIGAGGAALALAGLELAPRRERSVSESLVVTGTASTAALVGPRWPARRTENAAERAATLASHDVPDTTHAPAGHPSPVPVQSTGADIGAHVTEIFAAAEEAARQILDDARAEAARITSTVDWLEQAGAESQRRLNDEAAELLRVCRAAEVELVGAIEAIRELSAVAGSDSGPADSDLSAVTTAGGLPGERNPVF